VVSPNGSTLTARHPDAWSVAGSGPYAPASCITSPTCGSGDEEIEDLIPLCASHHAKLHDVFDHSAQWRARAARRRAAGSLQCFAAGWRFALPRSLHER